MLLIFVPKRTNRLMYTFKLVLNEIIGVNFKLTTDSEEFKHYQGPRINYSNHAFGDEVFIYSRHLLFETGIIEQQLIVSEYRGNKLFFSTVNNASLPFDIFAATFYLVSRYEEYLPHIRDHYDRFDAKESFAQKNSFLQKPVVNIWASWLKELLKNRFPELVFQQKKYRFISTIDIDNAFAYREKGLSRTIGGYAKSLAGFDFDEVQQRTRVLLGLSCDPYDTYDFQLKIQQQYQLSVIYFFLLGDYGINDKNLSIESRAFQSLIKKLSDYADVGIHPSFGSNAVPGQLKKEMGRLSQVIHRDITKSRQHFLKLRLPETYRNLIDLDITDDYTMGFAAEVGFRAGICTSFNFYDLDMESETKLKVHPFAVMEGTLKYYMKADPEDAMTHIKPLIDEIKAVDGTFISLWHNETMSDTGLWEGWRQVYEEMVKYAV